MQITVCCVHWLWAQAQLMRWKEKVTLKGYEMQWTIRYFSYMSQKWILPQNVSSPDICGSSVVQTMALAPDPGTASTSLKEQLRIGIEKRKFRGIL